MKICSNIREKWVWTWYVYCIGVGIFLYLPIFLIAYRYLHFIQITKIILFMGSEDVTTFNLLFFYDYLLKIIFIEFCKKNENPIGTFQASLRIFR